MKKIMAALLVMLLLSGCAVTAPGETTDSPISAEATSEQETVPTFSAADETKSKTETPSVIPAKLAKHQTDIYIPELNMNRDIYQDSGGLAVYVYIYSDEELDLNSIDVDIPIQTSYSFMVEERQLGVSPDQLAIDASADVRFSYDTYLSYAGFDWSALREKYDVMQEAHATQRNENTSENREKYTKAYHDYYQLYESYWDDYLLLTESMLPQFHAYTVMIIFEIGTTTEDEVVNCLDLTIGGKTATVDIGEVRLHTQNSPLFTTDPLDFLGRISLGSFTPISTLYERVQIPITFTTKQDLMLTGFNLFSSSVEINGIEVQIISQDNNSSNFLWDGKSPIPILAESTVELWTTFEGEDLEKFGFQLNGFVNFEFDVDGVSYEHTYEHKFHHEMSDYEEYAKHFDGIDFTEYYEKYYYPIVLGLES